MPYIIRAEPYRQFTIALNWNHTILIYWFVRFSILCLSFMDITYRLQIRAASILPTNDHCISWLYYLYRDLLFPYTDLMQLEYWLHMSIRKWGKREKLDYFRWSAAWNRFTRGSFQYDEASTYVDFVFIITGFQIIQKRCFVQKHQFACN